jgi:hypothetical protein
MSLSEVTTAAVVDDQGQAMGVAREDFNADTPTIYLSARINNAPPDTEVTAEWLFFKDSNNKELTRSLYDDSITLQGRVHLLRPPCTLSHGSRVSTSQIT